MIRTPWLTPAGAGNRRRSIGALRISQASGRTSIDGWRRFGRRSALPLPVEVIADFARKVASAFVQKTSTRSPLLGAAADDAGRFEFRQFPAGDAEVAERLGGLLAVAGAGRRSEGPGSPERMAEEDTRPGRRTGCP